MILNQHTLFIPEVIPHLVHPTTYIYIIIIAIEYRLFTDINIESHKSTNR